MTTMLKAVNIQKTYGSRGNLYPALNGIDLEIQKGEFIGVMGPSGAGKSTLLHVLSTIDSPSSGEIQIAGQQILSMNDSQLSDFRRESLGFIFQDYNLLDTLTVHENISLPLALSHVPAREIKQRVQQIASTFGIDDLLDKYPYQISGGQKQRAAASRAMVSQPELIFADEPTGALDSKSAANLLDNLALLNEQEQATIMMVTHDAFAASFCKRVLFIVDGCIAMELHRMDSKRQLFLQRILDVLASFGGDPQ